MSTWSVKPFKTRSLKGYKIPKIEDLKQGDIYYTKDPHRSTMNNEWVFDINYHKSLCLDSYYIKHIKNQIELGLIWIKE